MEPPTSSHSTQAGHVSDTVLINIVTDLRSDGKYSGAEAIDLPKRASWTELQAILTKATATWQAADAGYPGGYSLVYGKWLYQTYKASIPGNQMFDLVTEQQYQWMRDKIEYMGVGVLVWHERVVQASQEAKARTAQEESKRDA